MKPDYGLRPWQIVKDLFRFRNTVAHGKPEDVEDESELNLGDYLAGFDFVQADWEKFATEGNAIRAKEAVEEIAKLLYDTAKIKHDGPIGPFSFGFQVRRARL